MAFSGKILAGWIIDGSGAPARKRMMVAIQDGTVTAVRPEDACDPGLENVLDCGDATLLPRLIDSHVHLSLPDEAASLSDEVVAERLCRYFRCGVMAVRDGGDKSSKIHGIRNAMDMGERLVADVYSAGSAFYKKGRYGGFIGSAVSDADDLPDLVALRAPLVDHIKIINSGLNSLARFGAQTSPQFTADQLKRAVSAAGHFGRKVMVHANGGLPVADALQAGCASIEHGYFMGRENLAKMRDLQITWVPTAIPMKALADYFSPGTVEADVARRTLDHQLEQMALALRLGVPVAAGTDAGSPGVAHGTGLIEELKLLISAGYTVEAAIRCASDAAARLIGTDTAGRLAPGMPAVFVAVPGPPENLPESLTQVRFVCRKGDFITTTP